MSARASNLTVGQPFMVVQLFGETGYITSIFAPSLEELKAKVAARKPSKNIVVCSVPFEGNWNGDLPVVTLPPDFKQALSRFDFTRDE